MIKIRSIIVFAIIPAIAGYTFASLHSGKGAAHHTTSFNTHAILPTDRITLTNHGTILSIASTGIDTVSTNQQSLIEANPLGNAFVAVDKQINYSSLEEFSHSGLLLKTLLNGNTRNIDTMEWFMDPAVSPDQKEIAFVSDKDKEKTNVLDNALFVDDVSTGALSRIADPDPHSGGIAHPTWNPHHPNVITYDYYQYDTYYNPYSVIQEYDTTSQTTTALTTREENAYQESFSPDGKQMMFLGRNSDNTVTMYIAAITDKGLSAIKKIATGDFAYPTFSSTQNYIYYLQAQGNSGYDLYKAHLVNNTLQSVSSITTDGQLEGNAGFSVTKL